MQRSEVWWVNFDPSIGGDIKKKRPAVIISNNASNKFLNRIQVVPLSSKMERLYPARRQWFSKERKARLWQTNWLPLARHGSFVVRAFSLLKICIRLRKPSKFNWQFSD
jgi:hypothetical protein